MKLSIYDSSGWVGDAYSSDGSGGGNFIDWLWKTFCISMFIGFLEYLPLYLCPKMLGVNYTVLHPEQLDYSSFSSKALVCGAFVFSSLFMTIKNNKLIIMLIATYIINYGYCFACESLPILGKVLIPFTWIVSGIFIALGVIPIYIIEHLMGINMSMPGIWGFGILFGIIVGGLYLLIFHKGFAWDTYWN